jgi:D-glycero-D-manno-heptose 1,7-bisphosphate phosphatase
MRRAIFLDRDGVINKAIVRDCKPYPPATLAELEILPGVKDALVNLRMAGFLLIVITNQPDVARGITRKEVVEEINTFLTSSLCIDEFRTCYHDSNDNCSFRKPEPGALIAAARKYHIDLDKSFMVGDRWRDVEAGQRAGCKTCFIDYGYAERQPENIDFRVRSLFEAAQIIVRNA